MLFRSSVPGSADGSGTVMTEGDGGGANRRRRLPPASVPGSADGSGMRFVVLAPIDDGAAGGAEEVASRVALDALEGEDGGDGGGWIVVGRRQPDERLLQEFWEYAGFPTPESSPWEASSSATAASSTGASSFSACRSSDGRSRSAPTVVLPAAAEIGRAHV